MADEVLFEENQDLKVEQGYFLAYLGDKEVLPKDLFKRNSIVYVGIRINSDDELKPLLQLGTAPYAAFANTCEDSDTVGGKSVDQIVATARSGFTSSGTGTSAIQGPKGDTGPQGVPGAPATFKYRFISVKTGDCHYDLDTNATVCSCQSGEIALAAGGWAGFGAVLNASRHPLGPDLAGTDAERARQWTISCLKFDGAKVECVEVQVLCLRT